MIKSKLTLTERIPHEIRQQIAEAPLGLILSPATLMGFTPGLEDAVDYLLMEERILDHPQAISHALHFLGEFYRHGGTVHKMENKHAEIIPIPMHVHTDWEESVRAYQKRIYQQIKKPMCISVSGIEVAGTSQDISCTFVPMKRDDYYATPWPDSLMVCSEIHTDSVVTHRMWCSLDVRSGPSLILMNGSLAMSTENEIEEHGGPSKFVRDSAKFLGPITPILDVVLNGSVKYRPGNGYPKKRRKGRRKSHAPYLSKVRRVSEVVVSGFDA
tara:strand:- start:80 stop:892 length:813 start_codon:yes stop_codon:yes gene_type:complete